MSFHFARGAFAACLLTAAAPAFAQDADGGRRSDHELDAGSIDEPDDGGLTEADLRELEAAIAQDTAAADAGTWLTATPAGAPGSNAATSFVSAIQTMNPDISLILDVAAAAFSVDGPLQTGGHDPRDNGFNLQQLELSMGRTVDPYFRFDSNVVFALSGVEIEEAYATTLDLPYRLQVRAGRFLTRVGRINSTHPHSWEFLDQPFIIGRFLGSEGAAGLGAEVSWLSPLPWYVEVVGSANDASTEGSARSFYAGTGQGVHSPLDLQLTGALKQFFDLSDDLSLLWGLSGVTGPNNFGHETFTNIYGSDLYLKYRPLKDTGWHVVSLQIEGFLRRRQVANDLWTDYGLYAQLFYRVAQRWALGARFEHGSATRDLSGSIISDDLDPEWLNHRQRCSGALTFWPTEFSRLRLELQADVPQWEHRIRYAAMLGFEVVIGAHGSHAF